MNKKTKNQFINELLKERMDFNVYLDEDNPIIKHDKYVYLKNKFEHIIKCRDSCSHTTYEMKTDYVVTEKTQQIIIGITEYETYGCTKVTTNFIDSIIEIIE